MKKRQRRAPWLLLAGLLLVLLVAVCSVLHIADVQVSEAPKVLVSVETGHFFGDYERVVPCDIPCEFRRSVTNADARWYHLCGASPQRERPSQALILMSMESSVNYPCLGDGSYLKQFDIKATYRMDSHVPIIYLMPDHLRYFERPLNAYKNTVVFLQGNCNSRTGREDVVKRLVELAPVHKFTVESRGSCLNNAPPFPRGENKKDGLKSYKFALSFENSEDTDYITEKIWDSLAAGNIPIYFGAREIETYIPHPMAFINFRKYETPERLADYLDMLIDNQTLYGEHHRWRRMPIEKLNPGYQQLVRMVRGPHSQCLMCKQVAAWRESHGVI